MKHSKFIGIIVILVLCIGLFADDFSDLYLGTAYKRLLVLRNGTALTGLNATSPYEPERVYDGGFTNATPFSLSTRIMRFFEDYQLQFRGTGMYIHSDGATSLFIDGSAKLTLEATAITAKGALVPYKDDTYDLGEISTPLEWKDLYIDGTAYLDAADIDSGTFDGTVGGTTPGTGTFLTLSATGNVSLNGGTLIYNTSEADKDFRFAGLAQTNLLFGDAALARIGINTALPSATLDIVGTLEVSGAITATGGIDGAVGAVTPTTGAFTTATITTATITTANISGTATFSGAILMAGPIEVRSGNLLAFDADDNSGIKSDADDVLTFQTGGTSMLTLGGGDASLYPSSDGTYYLGLFGTNEWKNIYTQDLSVSDDLNVSDAASIGGAFSVAGTFTTYGASTFNSNLADIDFTVKSDDNAIAFVVDASQNNIEFGASISYNGAQRFVDSDETPSVAGYSNWTTNTTAVTITAFDGGAEYQYIIIKSAGAITYDVTGTFLKGGTTDLVTAAGDITHWLRDHDNWYLQTFIDQSQDLNVW